MTRTTTLLPAGLLLAIGIAGSALAQTAAIATAPTEDTVQPRPAILTLAPSGGGTPHTYQVDEISLGVSQSYDGRGEARADVSLSLSQMRPIDGFLLEWMRQGAAARDALREGVITVPARPPSDTAFRYELEDAKVVSFSATHSASGAYEQLSLSVSVKRLTLNGIVLN